VWRQDQGAGDFIGNRWTRSRYSDIATTTSGKYLRLVAGSHLLSAGWDGADARRLEAHSDRTADTVTPAPVTALQDFRADVRRLALFAQDEWSRSASLSLYLGVRWETLSTRSHGSGFDAVSDRFDVLSPILQVLWKLPGSKNDQLRFALARTYKAPDANSLPPRRYIADNNSATNPDSIGNPHLRPELSTGVDGAFEHFLAGGGTLSASVYVRRIRDVTVTRINNIDGRWVAMLSNLGQADTHGIELEAKFPLKTFYKAAPAIDFRSNIAFNWSRLSGVPGPYNRLDAQTPVSGSIGIDYKPDRVPLAVGASFTFQKGGPVRISPVQINTAAFKRVLDAYALWTIDPKLSWRLSASNILQQDNISGKFYADADGSRSQTTIAPTMVQWRLVLEKKF
jgi:outer membrane receptor protein involved in Fe transport